MTTALNNPPQDVQSAVAALVDACRQWQPTDVPVDEHVDPRQPSMWSNATFAQFVRRPCPRQSSEGRSVTSIISSVVMEATEVDPDPLNTLPSPRPLEKPKAGKSTPQSKSPWILATLPSVAGPAVRRRRRKKRDWAANF
jgi:hypothetical protein